MNTKKLKGFTLVELIVVIAIIGVLAAILIPTMMGYVNKAKFTNANSIAKNLYNAGMAACREGEVTVPVSDGIYSSVKYGSSGAGAAVKYDEDFCKYVYAYFDGIKDTCWAIEVQSDCAVAACYQKTSADPYLGTHPCQNNLKQTKTDFDAFLEYARTGKW